MNEQERELDMMVAELEHENRLLRARNERLSIEVQILTNAMLEMTSRIGKLEVRNG
jgi:hypothetical protein